MSESLIKKILGNHSIPRPDWIEGYSEDEITKLELIFDISITGDLKCFFKEIGRCLGGILGDDSLIPYRDHWLHQQHLDFQNACRDDLIEIGCSDYVGLGEFFFSRESDGCFDYFVRTKSDKPDLVYEVYDDRVRRTDKSFIEHVTALVQSEANYLQRVRRFGTQEYIGAMSYKESWSKESWYNLMGKKHIRFRGNMLP